MQQHVTLVEKDSQKKLLKVIIIEKLESIAILQLNSICGTAHSICNLRFNMPNNIFVVFPNESNYDYHFIIKELANEFERKFECIGENTER